MSRKVFISVLGTGFYDKCIYTTNDFQSTETRFIQQATIENLLQNETWNPETDRIIIFVTQQSKAQNWDKSIECRTKIKGGIPENYRGLEWELEQMGVMPMLEVHQIPDGNKESEMWQIFTEMYNCLVEDDQLYLDITHSYRYIPMLLLVLCNYAKLLKRVTIKGVSYGNIFGKDERGFCPIHDLMPLVSLQDWTAAASDFVQYGRADKMAKLCSQSIGEIFAKGVSQDMILQFRTLRQFVSSIDELVSKLQLCQIPTILDGSLIQRIRSINTTPPDYLPAFLPLMEKIETSFSNFSDAYTPDNFIMAAEWCCQHKYYQQAVTLLREGVITTYCHALGWDVYNRDLRELISSALFIVCKDSPRSAWEVEEKYIPQLEQLLNSGCITKNIAMRYGTLGKQRNKINHAGMNTDNNINIMSVTRNFHTDLMAIYEHLQHLPPATLSPSARPKVFINLSNHPSSLWEKPQLMAAHEYGTVEDMPFPVISAKCSEREIDILVQETFDKLMARAVDAQITVHLMGEMTFTFALVAKLKKVGIPVVASCSERRSEQEGGLRISEFSFERFRHY